MLKSFSGVRTIKNFNMKQSSNTLTDSDSSIVKTVVNNMDEPTQPQSMHGFNEPEPVMNQMHMMNQDPYMNQMPTMNQDSYMNQDPYMNQMPMMNQMQMMESNNMMNPNLYMGNKTNNLSALKYLSSDKPPQVNKNKSDMIKLLRGNNRMEQSSMQMMQPPMDPSMQMMQPPMDPSMQMMGAMQPPMDPSMQMMGAMQPPMEMMGAMQPPMNSSLQMMQPLQQPNLKFSNLAKLSM
jgi:hypothetical protein